MKQFGGIVLLLSAFLWGYVAGMLRSGADHKPAVDDPLVVTLPDETKPGERRSVFLRITDVSTYEDGSKDPPGEFKRVPNDWMFRMGSTARPYFVIARPTLPPRGPMDPPR